MEIVYTLRILLSESIELRFVSKSFKEVQAKIMDFQESYGDGPVKISYLIEVRLEEDLAAARVEEKTLKRRKGSAAWREKNKYPPHKKHTGRGRPKGWKPGMTFEEARERPEIDEEADSDPFNT